MFLALVIGRAWAAEPAIDAETQARKLTRTGAIEVAVGAAAVSGGIVMLLVGRGEPGELSNETQRTSDLKSFGGAGLLIGGFTMALVGGNTLSRARAVRESSAAQLSPVQNTVVVIPIVDPRGGGLQLSGTF